MEIFGLAARDFAAFWGAGLSTLLVLTKLLHPRPVVLMDFVRDRTGTRDVRLSITNPASYPVMLINVSTPVGGRSIVERGSIEGWKTFDAVTHTLSGKLNLLIQSQATVRLEHRA